MMKTESCCRSEALATIASKHNPHSSVIADNLNLPHPDSFFDFAISVAVIHHLSTSARRVRAIEAILRTLRPAQSHREGGKALIYVWALEQKTSRRGWDTGDDQDVMVPWVMKEKSSVASSEPRRTFHRYYHLYESQELERDITEAGGLILDHGYEKDNWWAIASPQPRV
jgi:tRNA (uracil-5-)-methyltransferase TRM9